jgi:hypothetical protein
MATDLSYDESSGDVTATMNGASWIIHVDWFVRDGSHEPCAVTISMKDRDDRSTGAQLTASVVRKLAIGDAIQMARHGHAIQTSTQQQYWELVDLRDRLEATFAAGHGDRAMWAELDRVTTELERLDTVRETPVGPKRGSKIADDTLREVADVYQKATRLGSPVTRAVATHFHVSESTAGKRIMKARERGFLPPPGEHT